jgi:RNA polymerase sigma factor (sigma-70 family)
MIGTASVLSSGFRHMNEAGARRPGQVADPTVVLVDAESTLDLVARARTGDEAATAELFDRYGARLRRWAHGRLPSAARGAMESQDLVQETLTRVFQRLPAFEPRHPGAFRDYVWTTLWNCIRDVARRYQHRGPSDPLDGDIPDPQPTPLEEAMGRETFARYEAALERLDPDEREAIIARIELGLSHAEVAEALGKSSAAAAHMAVSRALIRLAREMAHDRKPTA